MDLVSGVSLSTVENLLANVFLMALCSVVYLVVVVGMGSLEKTIML